MGLRPPRSSCPVAPLSRGCRGGFLLLAAAAWGWGGRVRETTALIRKYFRVSTSFSQYARVRVLGSGRAAWLI